MAVPWQFGSIGHKGCTEQRLFKGSVKGLSRACQGLVKGLSRDMSRACQGLVKGL